MTKSQVVCDKVGGDKLCVCDKVVGDKVMGDKLCVTKLWVTSFV